eukprot:COSAG06_NODE_7089_length_2638_cov_4.547853_2_plen_51_part_00
MNVKTIRLGQARLGTNVAKVEEKEACFLQGVMAMVVGRAAAKRSSGGRGR